MHLQTEVTKAWRPSNTQLYAMHRRGLSALFVKQIVKGFCKKSKSSDI